MAIVTMDKIVSLAKRRGFVYPGSDIYGGLANTWDYGPLGARILQNIKNLWWKTFVETRSDMYSVDTSLIMKPKVWEASGHVSSFTDPLVECKVCHARLRADKPEEIKEHQDLHKKNDDVSEVSWTEPKNFNLMFKTHIGVSEDSRTDVYLRPETAQGMFVNFKNVLTTERPRLPFGIAQIGKAFRNEITPGNFIFRTLEFEQMEIEYFVKPSDWEAAFEGWKIQMWDWITKILEVDEKKLKWRAHEKDELSHYSKRTEDIEFEFPFGWGELYGLAYRTDFDLKNHAEKSGEDLQYTDPETNEKFFPHVVEPTFGVNRTVLVVLLSAYTETDDGRTLLKLNPKIAPYKAAVFPLVSNKPDIVGKAKKVYDVLRVSCPVSWDDRGNIGKRYASQDEIGTPWCITVDYQTLEDDTVTVRDRDTGHQVRVAVPELQDWISSRLH
ncbi:MAG: glycine--tRNA ligase [Patescibacteria group bacterium]